MTPLDYSSRTSRPVRSPCTLSPSLLVRHRLTRAAPDPGDEKAVALWTRFRELSINRYKETYAQLNIKFDVYSGESQVQKKSMDDALDRLQEMGVVVEKDGALIAELDQWKLESTVVRKKGMTDAFVRSHAPRAPI